MAEPPATEPIPLALGGDGVIRVRGTRVTLETVWSAFGEGATAEEISQRYPPVSLAGRRAPRARMTFTGGRPHPLAR